MRDIVILRSEVTTASTLVKNPLPPSFVGNRAPEGLNCAIEHELSADTGSPARTAWWGRFSCSRAGASCSRRFLGSLPYLRLKLVRWRDDRRRQFRSPGDADDVAAAADHVPTHELHQPEVVDSVPSWMRQIAEERDEMLGKFPLGARPRERLMRSKRRCAPREQQERAIRLEPWASDARGGGSKSVSRSATCPLGRTVGSGDTSRPLLGWAERTTLGQPRYPSPPARSACPLVMATHSP